MGSQEKATRKDRKNGKDPRNPAESRTDENLVEVQVFVREQGASKRFKCPKVTSFGAIRNTWNKQQKTKIRELDKPVIFHKCFCCLSLAKEKITGLDGKGLDLVRRERKRSAIRNFRIPRGMLLA